MSLKKTSEIFPDFYQATHSYEEKIVLWDVFPFPFLNLDHEDHRLLERNTLR